MAQHTFKTDMKEYYDNEAALRNAKTERADWKIAVRNAFCDLCKSEGKQTLLELGAGAGYDSLYFAENGFAVTAVDLSSEMVKCCREKGLDARELDFYNLTSLCAAYDCVYALNSLLHVPISDLPLVLKQIDAVLNHGGLFYMGLYGGDDTENDFVRSDVSDAPRRFAFYSAEHLKNVLPKYFSVVRFETISVADADEEATFHSVILSKP